MADQSSKASEMKEIIESIRKDFFNLNESMCPCVYLK